jgi:hypothetical protein
MAATARARIVRHDTAVVLGEEEGCIHYIIKCWECGGTYPWCCSLEDNLSTWSDAHPSCGALPPFETLLEKYRRVTLGLEEAEYAGIEAPVGDGPRWSDL